MIPARSLGRPLPSSCDYHRRMLTKSPESHEESARRYEAKISRRGANRLKDGHVWVYRSDILAADGIAPGALVEVVDERGKFLGTALYSSASQIAIRMIAKETVKDLDSLLRKRIR